MNNLLNLPDWWVYGVRESAEGYQFTCAYPALTLCPRGHAEDHLQRFGSKDQLYLDLPMHGKRVALLVHRHRYRCKVCGKTFWQPVPDMDDRRWMTARLVQYIQTQALRRTFVSIASEIGLDEKTIRNIFHDYLTTLEAARAVPTPIWLGIDELTLAGKPRCILTNLQEGSVFDLLASRTQAVVTAYLRALPHREHVQVACMDMWSPYRTACQLCLPQARIIVDKFHVMRMANQALESVRKTLRVSLSDRQRRTLMHDRHVLLRRQAELSAKDQLILESWQGSLPLLSQAYQCKETFYAIWDADNVTDAEQRYAAWRQQLPVELTAAFAPLTTAMTNWHAEIFGYFAVPGASVTNAITEALNCVAKVTNRLGRGYSFAVVRAKMLYAKRSGLLSTSYRRIIAAMPYNLPIGQQDAEVMVDEIAYLVDMMERLDDLQAVARRHDTED